jgi:hypothetical protein
MNSKKYNVRVIDHSKSDGHVGYDLKIELENNKAFRISKRYSDLKTLNDLLRKETSSSAFPKFPPKKFFGYNSEEFLKKRQQELDVYFTSICNSPEFSQIPSFIKFVEDCLKSQSDGKVISNDLEPSQEMATSSRRVRKTKTMCESYREKFQPSKNDFTKLSYEEAKKEEKEFKNIVEDSKKKFYAIDFEVKQNISKKSEKKYNELIKKDKGFTNNKGEVQSGNDDNFKLAEKKDNTIASAEQKLKKKIDEIINKQKKIVFNYDINEILKTL